MNRALVAVLLFVVAAFAQTSTPAPTHIEGYAKIPSNFNTSEYYEHGWPIPKGGAPDVVGAFRFICNPSHLSYDDPIVYPGKPGATHLHQWYGNTAANGHSTYETLRKTGNSTCQNILNRSAYWMPAMMDGKGGVVRPDYISIYYKRRPQNDPWCQVEGTACIPLPRGLRYIWGFDMLRQQPVDMGAGYFNCDGPTATPGHYPNIIEAGKNCPVGNKLGAVISAPHCWDGQNLDSADHRSHVTYGGYGDTGIYRCPPTHPWVIPTFTLGAWYTVDGNLSNTGKWDNVTQSPSTWYLSSDVNADGSMHTPGTTYHADWFGAWDDEAMGIWHDNCIDKFLNCAAGELGNGMALKMYKEFSWNANPRVVPVPVNPNTNTIPYQPTPTPNPTSNSTSNPNPNPPTTNTQVNEQSSDAMRVICSISLLLSVFCLLF